MVLAGCSPSGGAAPTTHRPVSSVVKPRKTVGVRDVIVRPYGRSACPMAAFRLLPGGTVSAQAGEHILAFGLQDAAARPCAVVGYPRVRIERHRQPTPLHAAYGVGYVSDHARRVRLTPGQSAYFIVAKYRCDVGEAGPATRIVVRLRHRLGSLTRKLTGDLFNRCRRGNPAESFVLDVSPFTSSLRAAVHR